jgi:hypothetical protein
MSKSLYKTAKTSQKPHKTGQNPPRVTFSARGPGESGVGAVADVPVPPVHAAAAVHARLVLALGRKDVARALDRT